MTDDTNPGPDETVSHRVPAESEMPPPPRPHVEGYVITREIHRGGQGVVYQAIQKSTKRKVAIKLLIEGRYATKTANKRFDREVELIAQLKHPDIITIFDSGVTDDGMKYYVMDYVSGLPLHRHVRERKLSLEDTLKLFARICEAVDFAHKKGIIHRDLKPSNVMVDSDGNPRVLDFGLAKAMASPLETLVTVTKDVIGTLPYMSPEQARGNPEEIDHRSDVYSLGIMLYELLTGRFPYPVHGQVMEILKNILDTPPSPPALNWSAELGIRKRVTGRSGSGSCPIDSKLEAIVLKALSKDRLERYSSADSLREEISNYLAGGPIQAVVRRRFPSLRGGILRRRNVLAVIVVLILLTPIGLLVQFGKRVLYERRPFELVIIQHDRINTAMHSHRASNQQDGEPLEITIVTVHPHDHKYFTTNDRLRPIAGITAADWYEHRPTGVGGEQAERIRIPSSQIYLLTNKKGLVGKVIGPALCGATQDGWTKKKIGEIEYTQGTSQYQATIYVFPKFIGPSGEVLPVKPVMFDPPGAFERELDIEIGVQDGGDNFGQFIRRTTKRRLVG